MLSSLTAKQLAEWEMYLTLDPPEARKDDYRMAYMSSLLTNLVIRTMGSKGAKLTSVSDFLVEWDAEKARLIQEQPQSVDDMKQIFAGKVTYVSQKIERNKQGVRTTPPLTKMTKK